MSVGFLGQLSIRVIERKKKAPLLLNIMSAITAPVLQP